MHDFIKKPGNNMNEKSSKKNILPIQRKTDSFIQKAKAVHELHNNPYLDSPETYSRISQRMEQIKSDFEKKQKNRTKTLSERSVSARTDPSFSGYKDKSGSEHAGPSPTALTGQSVEHRRLSVPFTTLTMIHTKNGMQHLIFREHYYSESNALPYQGHYHKHDYIELFFVVDGFFEQILLGEKRRFRKGEVVITDTNCEHADVITEETGTILFLWIQSDFLDQILRYYDGTDNLSRFLFHALREQRSEHRFLHLLPSQDSKEIEYILEQLVYEDYRHGPGFQDIIKWNLLRLFHLLCEQYSLQLYSSGKEEKEKVLLYEVERYISLHLSEVTILDLEVHFHYHRNYYNLLLKKHHGKSFREYVQNLRMDQAASLLHSSNLTIKQIAEAVGYENSSFFYHLFARYYGKGPLEYRNEGQKHFSGDSSATQPKNSIIF